jgi:hypothetical protein
MFEEAVKYQNIEIIKYMAETILSINIWYIFHYVELDEEST